MDFWRLHSRKKSLLRRAVHRMLQRVRCMTFGRTFFEWHAQYTHTLMREPRLARFTSRHTQKLAWKGASQVFSIWKERTRNHQLLQRAEAMVTRRSISLRLAGYVHDWRHRANSSSQLARVASTVQDQYRRTALSHDFRVCDRLRSARPEPSLLRRPDLSLLLSNPDLECCSGPRKASPCCEKSHHWYVYDPEHAADLEHMASECWRTLVC